MLIFFLFASIFAAHNVRLMQVALDELETVYNLIDVDEDGFVSVEEMKVYQSRRLLSDDDEEVQTIVVDNCSGFTYAGFSSYDVPSVVFENVVGMPRDGYQMAKDAYVGEDALELRTILTLKYPIEDGIVTNWEDMEHIYLHTFDNELGVSPKEHPILLTEIPLNPTDDNFKKAHANREKMTQMMFDTFEVPKMTVVIDAVLALYAARKTTGVVVHSTNAITQVVPIYEGYAIPHAILNFDVNGGHVTARLADLLSAKGHVLDYKTLQYIKEDFVYVALDFDLEMKKSKEVSYELPSGEVITLGSERFESAEILFNPSLIGKTIKIGDKVKVLEGIHEFIYESIMKCDVDIRKQLFENIILAGENTAFVGIADRMARELRSIAPTSTNINIVAPIDRKHSVWIGGAIFASTPSNDQRWITKAEYDKSGPSIVHEKCWDKNYAEYH